MRKKINEIEYEGSERMDSGVEQKFRTGQTPFSDNPALPDERDDNDGNTFEQLVASKRFKDVVNKVKQYTGVRNVPSGLNGLMELQVIMMRSVKLIKEIENTNEQYLEQLAVDLVKKELGVPEGSLQFDVELTPLGDVGNEGMEMDSEEPSEDEIQDVFGVTPEEAEDDIENFMKAFEMFDMEKAKRRFINSLIQGSAKKGHYMFNLVQQELNRIDDRLLNLYGVVMSINDLLYWILPDETLEAMSGGGGESMGGSEKVDAQTDPPTIVARGVMFPILVHEVIKGVMEVLGTQGLPTDPKAAEMVMASQDTLPYEIWDIRLGPVFWEKFIEAYPDKLYEDDMREIQSYLFSRFSSLSAEEFFELSKMILKGDEKGNKILSKMVEEIIQDFKTDDYESAMSKYDDDDDDDDEGGLGGLLSDLGIDLST
jgi:hypothetical protein